MLLEPLDDVNDDNVAKVTVSNVTINQSSVMIQVVLPYRRLLTYNVLAHGCDQHPVASTAALSNDY